MTAEFPLAVHALVYLAHKQTLVSSEELADNICTNPARVRKVMVKLHSAGLVRSSRGKGSGYALDVDASDLTLSAVLAALGESAVDIGRRYGDMDRDCLVSSGMAAVMDGVYANLNEACGSRLSAISVGEICENLFSKKRE